MSDTSNEDRCKTFMFNTALSKPDYSRQGCCIFEMPEPIIYAFCARKMLGRSNYYLTTASCSAFAHV